MDNFLSASKHIFIREIFINTLIIPMEKMGDMDIKFVQSLVVHYPLENEHMELFFPQEHTGI